MDNNTINISDDSGSDETYCPSNEDNKHLRDSQPRQIQTRHTDNIDDLEGEDVFNLKFPMSPMSNSELEQFLQQLDDLIEKLCIKDNKVTEWEEISREGEEADEIILRQGYFFRETITLLPMQRPVLYAMYNAIYEAWLTYRNYIHVLDADSDYDIEDNYMHFINDDCDENSDNDEDSDSDEGSESLDCNCRCHHYSVDNNTEENDTEYEHSENEVSDGYDDSDENSDNDENSDSHEGIESLDCNCRCRHYSVDNNTEDEHSENEVSDGYKDDDTEDEHSENEVSDGYKDDDTGDEHSENAVCDGYTSDIDIENEHREYETSDWSD